MENFLNGLSAYGTLSKEDADCLYHFFERKSFKKNTVLLTEGTISREAFFIVKGSLRQYFHNDKGIERTCNFAFENEFITDLESFSRKTRSTTNIICMEPVECLVITCDDLVRSMTESPNIAAYFNQLIETISLQNIRRIQSMLSKTPEEQLEDLLAASPHISQRVPQRYIAQYIGIEPESLSRIRKRSLNALKS